jgi:hypothetical protein
VKAELVESENDSEHGPRRGKNCHERASVTLFSLFSGQSLTLEGELYLTLQNSRPDNGHRCKPYNADGNLDCSHLLSIITKGPRMYKPFDCKTVLSKGKALYV